MRDQCLRPRCLLLFLPHLVAFHVVVDLTVVLPGVEPLPGHLVVLGECRLEEELIKRKAQQITWSVTRQEGV